MSAYCTCTLSIQSIKGMPTGERMVWKGCDTMHSFMSHSEDELIRPAQPVDSFIGEVVLFSFPHVCVILADCGNPS